MSWTLGNKLDFDKWRTDISGVRNNIHQDKKKKKSKGEKRGKKHSVCLGKGKVSWFLGVKGLVRGSRNSKSLEIEDNVSKLSAYQQAPNKCIITE